MTAAPANSERTMEAATPIFMLKRTGRAAEFELVEEAAPVVEEVEELLVVAVLLIVFPKPELVVPTLSVIQ